MNLDDLSGIKRNDTNKMMMSLEKFTQNILSSINKTEEIDISFEYSECDKIIAVGMGGSGIPGNFLRTILNSECSVPITVIKDYKLPKFIDDKTLVFAVSYSGTTDETINAFHEAIKIGAKVFGVTSGDRLLELLEEFKIPFSQAPAGHTTRESLAYLLFPMITVLQKLGLIKNKSNEIKETITILNELLNNYKLESLLTNNKAKQIALKIKDKAPLIYSSNELTEVVGLRWKQQFNENPKILAYHEVLPEATHNQLAIFEYFDKCSDNLIAIFLRSKFEGIELKDRIEKLKNLLMEEYGIEVLEFWGKGNTLLSQLLSLTFLGDFISFYLASHLDRDPSPTIAMSKLKHRLGLTDLTPQAENR